MLIKAGVYISRLRPEIRRKQNQIARLVWTIEQEELVVTSTYEGNHSEGSLHYVDLAEDIRRHKKGQEVRDTIQNKLGMDYDIVLRPTHIHIEYDPK